MSETSASTEETLYPLLARSGIGTPIEIQQNLKHDRVRLDGRRGHAHMRVEDGATLEIGGLGYRIERSRGGHLLVLPDGEIPANIEGPRLLQCGYHKCLTMYLRKVLGRTARSPLTGLGRFTHFFHRLDEFYRRVGDYRIASISGHAIDLDRFDDVRVARVIRDPRDLLVSGYHYHKREAESWCGLTDPEDRDWQVVNGKVPAQLGAGQSLAQYLNAVDLETGLLAEIEFRQYHFDSMLAWPDADPRVELFRYEDLVGNEAAVFDRLFRHFGFGPGARFVGRFYARKYRAVKRSPRYRHIRNPSAGQWREAFTPAVSRAFNERYGGLLEKLGYPLK